MNLIALTVMLSVTVPANGQLVLVDGGQPKCSIVIPDGAGQTVTAAAGELAVYIERECRGRPWRLSPKARAVPPLERGLTWGRPRRLSLDCPMDLSATKSG